MSVHASAAGDAPRVDACVLIRSGCYFSATTVDDFKVVGARRARPRDDRMLGAT
jgi:hypothetical protein